MRVTCCYLLGSICNANYQADRYRRCDVIALKGRWGLSGLHPVPLCASRIKEISNERDLTKGDANDEQGLDDGEVKELGSGVTRTKDRRTNRRSVTGSTYYAALLFNSLCTPNQIESSILPRPEIPLSPSDIRQLFLNFGNATLQRSRMITEQSTRVQGHRQAWFTLDGNVEIDQLVTGKSRLLKAKCVLADLLACKDDIGLTFF